MQVCSNEIQLEDSFAFYVYNDDVNNPPGGAALIPFSASSGPSDPLRPANTVAEVFASISGKSGKVTLFWDGVKVDEIAATFPYTLSDDYTILGSQDYKATTEPEAAKGCFGPSSTYALTINAQGSGTIYLKNFGYRRVQSPSARHLFNPNHASGVHIEAENISDYAAWDIPTTTATNWNTVYGNNLSSADGTMEMINCVKGRFGDEAASVGTAGAFYWQSAGTLAVNQFVASNCTVVRARHTYRGTGSTSLDFKNGWRLACGTDDNAGGVNYITTTTNNEYDWAADRITGNYHLSDLGITGLITGVSTTAPQPATDIIGRTREAPDFGRGASYGAPESGGGGGDAGDFEGWEKARVSCIVSGITEKISGSIVFPPVNCGAIVSTNQITLEGVNITVEGEPAYLVPN